ncbi:hypothetical protein [uncultured Treponema sp.]|uniref:hypothetical protein n=1 Tax=uncultured Treponema sp. TaxID=162155 RepID=UPI0025FB3A38|nr:hypothetical protein [uncultured Treponema sp.]
MTSDVFFEFKYNKDFTVKSPVIFNKEDFQSYNEIVTHEGGKTCLKNIMLINIDKIKDSLNLVPTPSSMDITFVVTKISSSEKLEKRYLLADFKFNVTAPNKVHSNISNDSIKEKFSFTKNLIDEKDGKIKCIDIAYFVFKNKNFEQIKNSWKRRNLNSPKNFPVKQADFERLFEDK